MGTFGAAVSALLNTLTSTVQLIQRWRQPENAQSRRNSASMRPGTSSMARLYAALFSRKDRPHEKDDAAPRSSLRRIVRRLRETLAFVFRGFSSKPVKKRDYEYLPDPSESSKARATKYRTDHSYRIDLRGGKLSKRSTGRPTMTRPYGGGGGSSSSSGIARRSDRHSKNALVVEGDAEKRKRKHHSSKDDQKRTDRKDRNDEKRMPRTSLSPRSINYGRVRERKKATISDYGDEVKDPRSTSRRHEERKKRNTSSSGLSRLLKRKKS